ncbi:MAG: hypothetical protein IPM82_06775 [Saprospiraceae bacterium]|nr:hypothetical protein [Saprospiraceae bacterium]
MENKLLNLDKLDSHDAGEKYHFAKDLLQMAKKNPAKLYPYFDRWVMMIKGDNNVLKWVATDIIGHLSSVDTAEATVQQIDGLVKFLHSGNLITSNHAIFSLGLIAKNKPEQRERIIKELLAISKAVFTSDECKDIAMGKVVDTLNGFRDEIQDDEAALNFIRQARLCPRIATKKKADALMNKITKASKEQLGIKRMVHVN